MGTAQVSGQLISLLQIKATEQTILVLNFFHCPNRQCVYVVNVVTKCVWCIFVKIAHVLMICLLRIDGCWCGPHWSSLAGSDCAARFRADICWLTCP